MSVHLGVIGVLKLARVQPPGNAGCSGSQERGGKDDLLSAPEPPGGNECFVEKFGTLCGAYADCCRHGVAPVSWKSMRRLGCAKELGDVGLGRSESARQRDLGYVE